MTRLLHDGLMFEVDCGAYRCRNCAERTDDECAFFGTLTVYPGPFAKGDHKRHEDCHRAEDAWNAWVKR